MRVRARDLVGRRIVAVQFNRFSAGRGRGECATQPVLTLDNGRRLRFVTQETDVGEYGTELVLTAPLKPPIRCCTAIFQTVEEWQLHASPLCRPQHVSKPPRP